MFASLIKSLSKKQVSEVESLNCLSDLPRIRKHGKKQIRKKHMVVNQVLDKFEPSKAVGDIRIWKLEASESRFKSDDRVLCRLVHHFVVVGQHYEAFFGDNLSEKES